MNAIDLSRFRAKARDFVADMRRMFPESQLPTGPDQPRPEPDPDIVRRYRTALAAAGLAGITWPQEYGGQGLTREHQNVFAEEFAGLQQPGWRVTQVGLGMCGPTLLALGTEAQKQRYLRPMLRGEEIWCQLFSEPSAGSDLAGLRTRAERDGDGWRVDGQKIWTSHARLSRFGMLIARTNIDVPKHRGITMFVVDMQAPGITVRPIRQITGQSEFNEVFMDGLRLPADAVVGAVDDGWRAAQLMLMNERTTITEGSGRSSSFDVSGLAALAESAGLADASWARQRTARLWARERCLDLLAEAVAAKVRVGVDPGPIGSAAKLVTAALGKQVAELGVDLAGATGGYYHDPQVRGRFTGLSQCRATAIAGGTDEIQRNIIAERVLGLPRDDYGDRGVPFRDLTHN
jgi:alkylation response protein AidB-like acyl-CoA dehydrogenase